MAKEREKENAGTGLGIRYEEIIKRHYQVYNRTLPLWSLKQEALPALEAAGLIHRQPDPNDRRRTLVYADTPQSYSTYLGQKYVEWKCGVTSKTSDQASKSEEKTGKTREKKAEKHSTQVTGRKRE
ncbi:MAG: hypothetical protein QW506_05780 [Thermoproteota archaeon]